MTDESLLKAVGLLGYPLFEKAAETDAEAVLARVAASRDLRLWEGFPLLLANAGQAGTLDPEKLRAVPEKPGDKEYLARLVLVSVVFYGWMGLVFPWLEAVKTAFPYKKADYDRLLLKFKKREDVSVGGKSLSPQRMKTAFDNYFKAQEDRLAELAAKKETFGVEYALSQVFSPKQKELFYKKLKGEVLTKTEREYYSRAVKKKVMALANPELHRLAQKLL